MNNLDKYDDLLDEEATGNLLLSRKKQKAERGVKVEAEGSHNRETLSSHRKAGMDWVSVLPLKLLVLSD